LLSTLAQNIVANIIRIRVCESLGKEYYLMLLIIGGIVLLLFLFLKKKDIRKAFFAALTAQLVTWPNGLLLTSLGAIEYPVRLFPKAIDSSFLHGYIMNPAIFAIYYIHYPKQAKLIWKWVYSLFITALPALIEVAENKYTDLINYKAWSGYNTWILLLISYYIIRRYLDWFFRNAPKQGVINNEN
jgi:hypothetical protein